MAIIKARAKWIGNVRSVVDNTRSHSVICDLPKESGGGDTGPTALELAVMSIADCAATIYAYVAKKSNIELTEMEVVAEAEKADDSPNITCVNLKVSVSGKARDGLLNACWRRTESYCPVLFIFKDPVPVKVAFECKTV